MISDINQFPLQSDPYWNNVVYMVQTTDTANARVSTGPSGTVVAGLSNSTTAIGTSTNTAISPAGYSFRQNGSWATFSSVSLTGDFTVECWMFWEKSGDRGKLANLAANLYVDIGNLALNNTYLTLSGTLSNSITTPGNQGVNSDGTPKPIVGAWYHLAATRASGLVTLWLNGREIGHMTKTGTIAPLMNVCMDTSNWSGTNTSTTGPPIGYWDGFRFTNGVARYTAPFNPPQLPYPKRS